MSKQQLPPEDRTIVIERLVQAPPDKVWMAWSDPTHIDQWWGPNGFRNQTLSMDFKPGGVWRYIMHGPDGKAWNTWIRYEEIVTGERLVYACGEDDSDEPHFHATVTFVRTGAGTQVSMRLVLPTAEACAAAKKFGAVQGGHQTLARLAGHLPYLVAGTAHSSMVLTRVFDAPVQRVFEAWSDPQIMARWWGPESFTLPVCELDFREGGAYRMVMRDPTGQDYPFQGHYRTIEPNRLIIFDAKIFDGVEVLTTVTFVAEEQQTRLTVQQSIPSDKGAAAGQTEGWSGSLEKLAAELATA